jgi:GNAT superfamily N-acetyltransferase
MSDIPRIYIREGRAADREDVIRFTEHTWDWGDYVPGVWDYWLTEPGSKWLVATIHGNPVAVGHVAMITKTEAWIEGLRVDPAYREHGIATKLTHRCFQEALKKGAKIVRFVTRSDNWPIHKLAAREGFTRQFGIVDLSIGAEKSAVVLNIPAARDLPRIASFLENSEVLKTAHGMISDPGWRFFKLTRDTVKEKLEQGLILTIGAGNAIEALAVTEKGYGNESLVVTFLDGEPEAVKRLIAGLRGEAAGYEPPRLDVRLIEGTSARRIVSEAGFKSVMEVWLFEKEYQ